MAAYGEKTKLVADNIERPAKDIIAKAAAKGIEITAAYIASTKLRLRKQAGAKVAPRNSRRDFILARKGRKPDDIVKEGAAAGIKLTVAYVNAVRESFKTESAASSKSIDPKLKPLVREAQKLGVWRSLQALTKIHNAAKKK